MKAIAAILSDIIWTIRFRTIDYEIQMDFPEIGISNISMKWKLNSKI